MRDGRRARATSASIEVLLFDLGGVLVDFDGVEGLGRLLREVLSPAQIESRWARCPHSLAFGSGALNADAFAEAFMRDWQIAGSPDAFVNAYRSWARGLLPGAAELLQALRPTFRLAALSNSNPLHWARLTDLGIDALFEVALSSHQVGHRKPSPEMYLAALSSLQVAPEAVLFLDDAQGNVEAARALGLQAERAEGVEGVRQVLTRRGLWSEP